MQNNQTPWDKRMAEKWEAVKEKEAYGEHWTTEQIVCQL